MEAWFQLFVKHALIMGRHFLVKLSLTKVNFMNKETVKEIA
jgi:hypothetical protein